MRIFLIGLSEAFARSFARYVSDDSRLALSGVAPSLALAGMLLPATRPDLVLIDWAALKESQRHTVEALRLGRPDLPIICVAPENEPYLAAAAHSGANAVISMNGLAEELEPLLCSFFPGRYGAVGVHNE